MAEAGILPDPDGARRSGLKPRQYLPSEKNYRSFKACRV